MAKYRMVQTEFWRNPVVSEEMTPKEKYFYLYLITNPYTTQIGIYKITKKQMAFDMGYSLASIESLMERFIHHHKLIRYNPETRELAIKNWGEDNFHRGGKPVMDCILSELKKVEDPSLIQYVAETIHKQEFSSLYESFYKQEELVESKDDRDEESEDGDLLEGDDDTLSCRSTIRGQKEKEKEKEKQQQVFNLNIESNPDKVNLYQDDVKRADVQEIIEFWDKNGFGFSNMNSKQQLLGWLDDSSFLQPKAVILKAMEIACANNRRRLNYIVGILKNWENESLLTVKEIDYYQENQRSETKSKISAPSCPAGRAIPGEFVLDLTAGEET
ncbi:DnaD and phage-associated domain-containing protein [Mesobacillus persicus]|uniref:DnaD and phage-associated domain-containing protein n=1 Tax=Mesobacillus persicus TaxID=930146 RepID=A0A1H7Z4V5_9BACI|nr:DnaD domain protein [Mesobacillus persicus]SEM52578.1 DnaD and phage-associated domain-containing protein [Mesobacillus persicus]